MSEKTDQGSDTTPLRGLGALPSDWDERLAAARVQRQKVLKAGGNSKTKRPWFPSEAGMVEINPPRAVFSVKSAKPAMHIKPKKAKNLIEPVRGNQPAATHLTSSLATQPISRLMAIGFACFFGLGCGVALSFGAIASLGMVFSDELTANRGDPPMVVEPIVPDIPSSLAFAEPASISAQVAPPEQSEVSGNVVTEAPEPFTIALPEILARFNPPQANELTLSVPMEFKATFQRNPLPAPLKALSKDVLNEVSSEPTQAVAFASRIIPLSNDTSIESVVMTDLEGVDAPPPVTVLSRLPVPKDTQRPLPAIGEPVDAQPSLASELGLRGPAAERYSLVTFAPTDVPDARIAKTTEHLQLTGFPVADGNWINFKVSTTHIRYYSEQDEMVALAVAETLGITARDFSHIENVPPAGRIDVWIQGNRNPNEAERLEKQEVSPSQRVEIYKTQLENRVVNSLKSGIHLGGMSP